MIGEWSGKEHNRTVVEVKATAGVAKEKNATTVTKDKAIWGVAKKGRDEVQPAGPAAPVTPQVYTVTCLQCCAALDVLTGTASLGTTAAASGAPADAGG